VAQENLSEVFKKTLPFWNVLLETEKEQIITTATRQIYKPKTVIQHSTNANSPGVQIVWHGRARAFISSPDGKQLTLQRVLAEEVFAIGISCILDKCIFDVGLETETQCEIVLIPRDVCKKLFDANIEVKRATINILASKLSKTMHILESVAFTSTKSRLANALIEQSSLAGSLVFKATHANIAFDLGTTREFVSRLLGQFQNDGLVTLRRGKIQINNRQALLDMRGDYLGYISNLLYPKSM
jgi:CRP/FNR family transcriptional regulator